MNIEELKRLAEAATPGPWVCAESWQSQLLGGKHSGRFEIRDTIKIGNGFAPLATVRGDKRITGGDGKNNAAYIAAANPAAVLELIAEVESLRAEVKTEQALSFRSQVAGLEQQRDELLAALKESRELVEDWGAYAPAYMQEKHDLEGDLFRLDAVISKMETP